MTAPARSVRPDIDGRQVASDSQHAMSFTKDFNTERQRLAPLFTSASEADLAFHAAWDNGVVRLGVSRYKETEEYAETLSRFHTATRAIDQIVTEALAVAKQGDLGQLATLIAYLDLPGRYFRSGYQRADIWRLLKQVPLDEAQSAIVRRIILHHLEMAGHEFTEAAKVALRVSSPDFCRRVQHLRQSSKSYVASRAVRLLMRIEADSM